ncbi:MAG: malonic semialdehyde reductase [Burkholderiales bacterium]
MLEAQSLDVLFRKARTHNAFLDRPVTDEALQHVHDLMKWGPTSANCQPARFLFVRSKAAKEKLAPALSPTNLDKTMKAPVTAIVAYDTQFYEHLPRMFAHNQDAINWFKGAEKKAIAEINAFRNGSLQGAYFILAARAVGLDCGPMSGFDNARVDAAFFPDGRWKSNFLCNLGYGDASKLMPRNLRFTFAEQCRVL